MTIDITYVYPGEAYLPQALRFIESYHLNPPHVEHNTVIALNCPRDDNCALFESMRNVRFHQHDNSGYDIGAFQSASRASNADMIVFLGASAYCRRPGWLLRMANAFNKRGNHLYGSMGNQGNVNVGVWAHIRTTGFWMAPTLMNKYPNKATSPEHRYPFEHGPENFTQWVWSQGLKAFVCDWENEYEYPNWDSIENGYHKGNQAALLTGDRNTEPPFHSVP